MSTEITSLKHNHITIQKNALEGHFVAKEDNLLL
jgi:hypothetical protein